MKFLSFLATRMTEYYSLAPIKLGCEVRGVDLKTEGRPEVVEQIKKDIALHRLLVFKDQGIISGQRHEISNWFGELKSTFYKHPKSPHPDVFRVSNDPNEGCTGMIMSYAYVIRNKKTKSERFEVLRGPAGK